MNDDTTVILRCTKCGGSGSVPQTEIVGSIDQYECLAERGGIVCRGQVRVEATLPPIKMGGQ